MGLKWINRPVCMAWTWRYVGHPRSRLCIRCRDQGFILPADPASPDMCRGHLAEERINNLLGFRYG